ncbi:MAG: hypothetical protein R2826_09795 [Thermoleophilia bacterium]
MDRGERITWGLMGLGLIAGGAAIWLFTVVPAWRWLGPKGDWVGGNLVPIPIPLPKADAALSYLLGGGLALALTLIGFAFILKGFHMLIEAVLNA